MVRKTFLLLAILLPLLGLMAGPVFPLDIEDGGMTIEDEEDPYFGEQNLFAEIEETVEDLIATDDIVDDVPPPTVVGKGTVNGIVRYSSKDEGWFWGMLTVKRPEYYVVVGRVKGFFTRKEGDSLPLVAKVINRDGKFRGVLEGYFDKKGFVASWNLDEVQRGKLTAKFVVPYGIAAFAGSFSISKDVFTRGY